MTPSEPPDQIRAFVAVLLPDDARAYADDQVSRLRHALGPAERAVRWVRPEGVHVTVQFLANVPTARLPALTERLAVGLSSQPPFALVLGRPGGFPNPRAPRVVLLEVTGNLVALTAAKERVEAATEPLGFPRERRPFQPHLTLGRVRERARPAEVAVVSRVLPAWPAETGPAWTVTSASLMRSQLGPGGATYTEIARLPFS